MTLEAARIRERLAQADRDLAEVGQQVAAGEIDDEIAARLRATYEQERDRLLDQLAAGGDVVVEDIPASTITGRRLAGAAILIIAAAGLTFGVVTAVGNGEPGAEGVAAEVVAGEGVNLDDITNEQMEEVVAQNPDIPAMRLALADRYFGAGEFSNALGHYMYVLETLGVQDAGALANVGWMTYLSSQPDVAASFVERSLEIQPDGGIVFWYLANIRFVGLGDAAGSIEPLQRLLDYDDLPEELRSEAEALLSQAEAAL